MGDSGGEGGPESIGDIQNYLADFNPKVTVVTTFITNVTLIIIVIIHAIITTITTTITFHLRTL